MKKQNGYLIIEMKPLRNVRGEARKRRLPFARMSNLRKDGQQLNKIDCVHVRRQFLGFFETIRMLVGLGEYRNAKNFVLDYFISSRRKAIPPEVEAEQIANEIHEYNLKVEPDMCAALDPTGNLRKRIEKHIRKEKP